MGANSALTADRGSQLSARPSALLQQPLLRVECRYKLTEISEVTFSELALARSSLGVMEELPPETGPEEEPEVEVGAEDQEQAEGGDEPGGLLRRERRHRLMRTGANEIVVSDLEGQRLASGASQSAAQLAQLLRPSQEACTRLGPLALDRDDPVIVEGRGGARRATKRRHQAAQSSSSAAPHTKRLAVPSSAPSESALDEELGSRLSMSCATLGSVVSSMAGQWAENEPQQGRPETTRTRRVQSTGRRNQAPFCNDTLLQRSSLVSGRYQLRAAESAGAMEAQSAARWSSPSGSSNHELGGENSVAGHPRGKQTAATSRQSHQLVAFLRLDHEREQSWAILSNLLGGQRDFKPQANLAPDLGAPTALAAASGLAPRGDPMQQQHPGAHALLAPPLLEWFINNQEVSTVLLLLLSLSKVFSPLIVALNSGPGGW